MKVMYMKVSKKYGLTILLKKTSFSTRMSIKETSDVTCELHRLFLICLTISRCNHPQLKDESDMAPVEGMLGEFQHTSLLQHHPTREG